MDDFLNKAFDSLEKSVVEPIHARAAEIVEEYPTEKNETLSQTRGEEAVQVAKDARLLWEEFDLASKLESWKKLLEQNERMEPAFETKEDEAEHNEAAGMERCSRKTEQGAQLAERAFEEALSELSRLPDPSNVILRLQRTVNDLTSVERENESLLAELEVAKRDARSVRGFKQQVKSLQEELSVLKQEAESSTMQQLKENDEKFEREKMELVAALRDEISKKAKVEEKASKIMSAKQVAEEKLLEVASELEAMKISKQNEIDEYAEELERAKASIKDLQQQLQESNASPVKRSDNTPLEAVESFATSTMVPQETLWDVERELSDARRKLQGTFEELDSLRKCSDEDEKKLRELQQSLSERPTVDQYNTLQKHLKAIANYVEKGDLAEESIVDEMAANDMLRKIKQFLDSQKKNFHGERSSMQAKIDEYEKRDADQVKAAEQSKEKIDSLEKTIAKMEADLLALTKSLPMEEDPGQFLNVIVSQRDRLKQMNDDLALEISQVNGKLESLRFEKQKLEKDNLALYEKAKYMEHWTQNKIAPPHKSDTGQGDAISDPDLGREARFACGPVNIPMGAGPRFSDAAGTRRRFGCFGSDHEPAASVVSSGPLEERYGKAYAAKFNPFQEFTSLEHQKQVRRLRLGDRVAYMMGQMIGNQVGRIFLVIYIMLLHFLVFTLVIISML